MAAACRHGRGDSDGMRALIRFGMVGALAALTHYAVASACIHFGVTTPAWANPAGFAVAFWVSYFGHYHFSFEVGDSVAHQEALPRFLMTALAGFLTNHLIYLALLRLTSLSPYLDLFIALVLVAAMTFVLSRYWAFDARR